MGKVFTALDKATQAETERVRTKKQEEPPAPKKTPPKPKRASDKSVRKPRVLSSGSWDERLRLAATVTGPVADSFRTLRARILHPPTGKPPKSLLVTSATPGEGKSFVCANLGIVLAQGVDNSSLIIDCDLRKPSLHRLFGLEGKRGLVHYLRDGDDLSELIAPAGIETLSLLPAGPPPLNPAELLESENMARLLRELESRYEDRVILLDSPPLQAASETGILAQHVDGVVLVVRWGGGRREHVQKLVELIGRDHIVGVVFNAYKETVLDAKVFGYYDYQNYSYSDNRASGNNKT